MFRGNNARYIFELLSQFKRGECDGIKIRLGRLQEFVSTACIEHLDFLSDHSGRHQDVQFNIVTEKVRCSKFPYEKVTYDLVLSGILSRSRPVGPDHVCCLFTRMLAGSSGV